MELFEKRIETKKIYEGRILDLDVDTVALPNGNEASREVVRHTGGVGVLAIDGEQNVWLVSQFRYPFEEVLLEIPAGKRDKRETPLECGKRELKEETGLEAKQFVSLGKIYPTPAYTDEVIELFLATGLKKGDQRLDPDEFLNLTVLPFKTAIEMAINGEITDAKTVTALLKAAVTAF